MRDVLVYVGKGIYHVIVTIFKDAPNCLIVKVIWVVAKVQEFHVGTDWEGVLVVDVFRGDLPILQP